MNYFSQKTIDFLNTLQANNNHAWFRSHRRIIGHNPTLVVCVDDAFVHVD